MPIWHPDCAAASVRWYYCCNKGGRVIDRHCGRCWCACECSTRKNICGYDFDPHFRRSLGLVWSYRITHSHVPMIVQLIKYHLNLSINILSRHKQPSRPTFHPSSTQKKSEHPNPSFRFLFVFMPEQSISKILAYPILS